MLFLSDIKHNTKLDLINEIWQAIMEMNPNKLFFLLDDTIDYEDIGKDKFIEKLSDDLSNHKTLGDN